MPAPAPSGSWSRRWDSASQERRNTCRVLLDAGLVSVRQEAQRRVYGVRAEPLQEVASWLEPYRQLWNERLDQLEHILEEQEMTP